MNTIERKPREPRKDAAEARATPSAERRKRIKSGAHRLKLHAEGIPEGYHPHWANDDAGRIQELMDRGYKFLSRDGVVIGEDASDGNTALDTRVSRIVGVNPQGTPKVAYLMVIPQEFYDEDMEDLSAENDALIREIREGQTARKAGDGRYVPEGGISLKAGKYKP